MGPRILKSKLLQDLRDAEADLMEFAHRYKEDDTIERDVAIEILDTPIPMESIPILSPQSSGHPNTDNSLSIHSIKVTCDTKLNEDEDVDKPSPPLPLVLVHGYGTSGVAYYRNLIALAQSPVFCDTVYSVDTLGCGLSSRVSMRRLKNRSPESIMQVAVEGLEAWREANKMDKFVLAAHSIGSVYAIAYCEKYPERVEQLVLLSPAAVLFPKKVSPSRYFLYCLYQFGISPGTVLRRMPVPVVRNVALKNFIAATDEADAFFRYHYASMLLCGCGERSILGLVDQGGNAARESIALSHRIPRLGIKKVSIMYGDERLDRMDAKGGRKAILDQCLKQQQQQQQQQKRNHSAPPEVHVYNLKEAHHALMLSQWDLFNKTMQLIVTEKNEPMPHAPCGVVAERNEVALPVCIAYNDRP